MSDADFVEFTKGLAELACCYGVAKVSEATAPCYWKHLKGRCSLPTEAIMKALGKAVSVYPTFFPSAGQIEALARPIAKTLENRRYLRSLPVTPRLQLGAGVGAPVRRNAIHEAAEAFGAGEITLPQMFGQVQRFFGGKLG